VLADRVLVMRRGRPLFEAIRINLTRARDRSSPLFEKFLASRADPRSIARSTAMCPTPTKNMAGRSDVVVDSGGNFALNPAWQKEQPGDEDGRRRTSRDAGPIKERYKSRSFGRRSLP